MVFLSFRVLGPNRGSYRRHTTNEPEVTRPYLEDVASSRGRLRRSCVEAGPSALRFQMKVNCLLSILLFYFCSIKVIAVFDIPALMK